MIGIFCRQRERSWLVPSFFQAVRSLRTVRIVPILVGKIPRKVVEREIERRIPEIENGWMEDWWLVDERKRAAMPGMVNTHRLPETGRMYKMADWENDWLVINYVQNVPI